MAMSRVKKLGVSVLLGMGSLYVYSILVDSAEQLTVMIRSAIAAIARAFYFKDMLFELDATCKLSLSTSTSKVQYLIMTRLFLARHFDLCHRARHRNLCSLLRTHTTVIAANLPQGLVFDFRATFVRHHHLR